MYSESWEIILQKVKYKNRRMALGSNQGHYDLRKGISIQWVKQSCAHPPSTVICRETK